jgi:16S rRNA (cytidine1402-2'-O)-methyltransferase
MSDLYLVATPIGNLEDISFRAIRILQEVPLIAAEDTRTTARLLKHYDLDTPLTSYHDHNKAKKTSHLIEHLENHDLALVSDAGTPAINDPGFVLVGAAIESGHRVIPIPGPSAPITALSASGLPTDNFLYLGYIPRKKKAREKLFSEVQKYTWTLVFLEAPHRLLESLEDCANIMGQRQIAVARELTKIHEEIIRGPVDEVRDYYLENPLKGEITLIIAGNVERRIWSKDELIQRIKEDVQSSGDNPSQLAKKLANETGWSRRDIYDLMQGL